ncbi:MAG: hypothetical protein H6R18_83 [Proteobacteria bacterium]|nr:hypothetical protein [Pseudomonadota bacterium]
MQLKLFLMTLMAALTMQVQAQTRVLPGSSAGYVYSPGTSTASSLNNGEYGCYKFKMDPSQIALMGSHGLFNLPPYIAGATGDAKYTNMELLSLGVVSGTPPKFSGILRLAGCYVKIATVIRPHENSCSTIDTHIARCDSTWSGEPNYGKGLSACVYTHASGVLTKMYYVEVVDLPVSGVVKSGSCAPSSGMWDNTSY